MFHCIFCSSNIFISINFIIIIIIKYVKACTHFEEMLLEHPASVVAQSGWPTDFYPLIFI